MLISVQVIASQQNTVGQTDGLADGQILLFISFAAQDLSILKESRMKGINTFLSLQSMKNLDNW